MTCTRDQAKAFHAANPDHAKPVGDFSKARTANQFVTWCNINQSTRDALLIELADNILRLMPLQEINQLPARDMVDVARGVAEKYDQAIAHSVMPAVDRKFAQQVYETFIADKPYIGLTTNGEVTTSAGAWGRLSSVFSQWQKASPDSFSSKATKKLEDMNRLGQIYADMAHSGVASVSMALRPNS